MNWLHFALGIALPALQMAIKNPGTIGAEKKILLEIRDAINTLFPGE